jgi:hypothetical protein
MRKIVFTLFILGSSFSLFSQTAPFGIKFDGFVREDAIFDSRQVEQLREGMFLYYPLNSNLDINGNDINARSSFNLFAIGARLSGKITGPEAFGAKTSGLLEGEFFGAANANINTFRLRHAFVKLNWSKTELLVGQTWHSLFTEECFPGTLNFNTGTPFQPFNRAPQIRIKRSLTNRIKVSLAALTQRDFSSTGPAGISYQYMSNTAIPEITLGISYTRPKTDSTSLLGFGIVGEYKQLLPRLVTDSNVRATQKIQSLAAAAYFQFENKRFGIKIKATYGQNLYDQLMLGGYAIKYDSLSVADGDWAYTNIVSGAAWIDAFVNIGKVNIAVFGGYSKNFGSFNNVSDWNNSKSYYSRGYNIDYVYRVAPRISCTFGSLKLGAEFDYTAAAYGNKLNSLGEVEQPSSTTTAKINEVGNTRILGMIQYNF